MKIIELLIENGADPNIENNQNKTPLFIAAERGASSDNVSYASKWFHSEQKTRLQISTTNRSIFSGNNNDAAKIAQILIANGVDVNKTIQFGSTNSTALITAAEYGRKKKLF